MAGFLSTIHEGLPMFQAHAPVEIKSSDLRHPWGSQ